LLFVITLTVLNFKDVESNKEKEVGSLTHYEWAIRVVNIAMMGFTAYFLNIERVQLK